MVYACTIQINEMPAMIEHSQEILQKVSFSTEYEILLVAQLKQNTGKPFCVGCLYSR
jgi:hypothetical protein